jgi:hypothetical protein
VQAQWDAFAAMPDEPELIYREFGIKEPYPANPNSRDLAVG